MSTDKGNDFRIEITNDKLVDLLMHAATRDDISNLRDKMDNDIADVRSEIKDVRSDVKDLRSELNELRRDMDSKFTWLYGLVVVSILIPLVAKFIPALH